jgi:hypothetical protein
MRCSSDFTVLFSRITPLSFADSVTKIANNLTLGVFYPDRHHRSLPPWSDDHNQKRIEKNIGRVNRVTSSRASPRPKFTDAKFRPQRRAICVEAFSSATSVRCSAFLVLSTVPPRRARVVAYATVSVRLGAAIRLNRITLAVVMAQLFWHSGPVGNCCVKPIAPGAIGLIFCHFASRHLCPLNS